jgi:hypothetical protein
MLGEYKYFIIHYFEEFMANYGMDGQYVKWTPELMVEVELETPDSFLLAKETLTRIGVASRYKKELYQTAHILYKSNSYYIIHYKFGFALDNRNATITINDLERLHTIAHLLEQWGLVKIKNPSQIEDRAPLNQIKIISHKEKSDWILVEKYSLGKKKKEEVVEVR